MASKLKEVIKQRKEYILQDHDRVYFNLHDLVVQALHARIICDAIWKYCRERAVRTGVHNSILNFSQVALENFAVLQLWKLFDHKNSVFYVWYVAEHLQNQALTAWLKSNIARIQKDITLIDAWRHVVVGHRGDVGYFAPDEYQKKFNTARLSEKRMQDFLLEFLCQIKFEFQKISVAQTMEELQSGLQGFEIHVKNKMIETFKDL